MPRLIPFTKKKRCGGRQKLSSRSLSLSPQRYPSLVAVPLVLESTQKHREGGLARSLPFISFFLHPSSSLSARVRPPPPLRSDGRGRGGYREDPLRAWVGLTPPCLLRVISYAHLEWGSRLRFSVHEKLSSKESF